MNILSSQTLSHTRNLAKNSDRVEIIQDNGINIIMTLLIQFDQLVSALEHLSFSLKKEQPKCWTATEKSSLPYICNSLTDYWYQDGRDGRVTNSYYAAAMGSEDQIRQIDQINRLKLSLKKQFSEIRNKGNAQLEETKALLATRHPVLARELATQGLARLHIKQLTRTIPVLTKIPDKLAFNWYQSGRSIRKTTKKEVLERLLKMNHGQANFRIQHQALAQIPDSSPLAIVQELAVIMRLNVTYSDGDRSAQNIAMPVFFPVSGQFPSIKFPAATPPENRIRRRRSDNQIEDTAFLPGLRVYKYINGKY